MVKGTTKTAMQAAIIAAFTKARTNGSITGANADAVINQLSMDIADAIDAYATTLAITVTVPPTPVVGGKSTVATQATG